MPLATTPPTRPAPLTVIVDELTNLGVKAGARDIAFLLLGFHVGRADLADEAKLRSTVRAVAGHAPVDAADSMWAMIRRADA